MPMRVQESGRLWACKISNFLTANGREERDSGNMTFGTYLTWQSLCRTKFIPDSCLFAAWMPVIYPGTSRTVEVSISKARKTQKGFANAVTDEGTKPCQ